MLTVRSNPDAPRFASSPEPGARSTGYARFSQRVAVGNPPVLGSPAFGTSAAHRAASEKSGVWAYIPFRQSQRNPARVSSIWQDD